MKLHKPSYINFMFYLILISERRNQRNAWKYAANEIVGLLKSVRKEGNESMFSQFQNSRKTLAINLRCSNSCHLSKKF